MNDLMLFQPVIDAVFTRLGPCFRSDLAMRAVAFTAALSLHTHSTGVTGPASGAILRPSRL